MQADSSGKMSLLSAHYVNQNVTLTFILFEEGRPSVHGTRTFPMHPAFTDEDDLIDELWCSSGLTSLVETMI
jgi:hypothetical protein